MFDTLTLLMRAYIRCCMNDNSDKIDTDRICWCLASVVTTIEASSKPGSISVLSCVVDIATSFAQHADYISDVRGERTRFAQFLCARMISLILRTNTSSLNFSRRDGINASLMEFSDRISLVADISALTSLPRLFASPWPNPKTDPLYRVSTLLV